MTNEFIFQNRMRNDDDAPPVVDNAKLPRMDEGPIRPRRINRTVLRMADEPQLVSMPDANEGATFMPPVPEEEPTAAMEEKKALPDQEEIIQEESQEQYVRLRLRVEQGEISVVGVHTVDGPLIVPNRLYSGLAYEVTRDKKRIGLGTLPDVGVMRGFPHPEGEPEQQGHSITEMPSYEFNVRVPRDEFSRWALPRIRVTVFRIKGSAPFAQVGPERLGVQFSDELRQVAQLKGIRSAQLSQTLQEQLGRALR